MSRPILSGTIALFLVPGLAGSPSFAAPAPPFTVMCQVRFDPDPLVRIKSPILVCPVMLTEMVRSDRVLGTALGKPEVAKLSMIRRQTSPLAWLEVEIRAKFDTKEKTLSFWVPGEDPAELQVLMSAILRAYIDEVRREQPDYFR